MKKEKDKNQTNHSFAFEEFIAINEIDITELPDYIQTMIRTISKQRADAKIKCTPPHYKIITKRLQKFADIVEDYLLNHFDDRLSNNELIDDEKDSSSKTKKNSKVNEVKSLADRNGRNYLLTSELRSLGIQVDYSRKEILIDELRLERELTTAKWYLGINQSYKEVNL